MIYLNALKNAIYSILKPHNIRNRQDKKGEISKQINKQINCEK